MPEMLRVFKALADGTRLRIIRLLRERDLCVCEIVFILGLAQSRRSHPLRILREAGLVEDTRDGQWIIYRLSPGSRAMIVDLLDIVAGGQPGPAREWAADRRMLKACLEKGFRKRRPAAAESGREAPGSI